MKIRFMTKAGAVSGLAALCVLALAQDNGPQNQGKTSTSSMATNWIGYVVFGAEETVDRIAPNPGVYPQTNPQVQIGLRSDGVVVWRKAPATR